MWLKKWTVLPANVSPQPIGGGKGQHNTLCGPKPTLATQLDQDSTSKLLIK
ncbi:UNVERIFIED_CONTAM: hypothetical protein FKN15_048061 [Acipenser sinensis]